MSSSRRNASPAPIDLVRNARHMLKPRNWLYHNYILNGMKTEALAEGARISDAEREIIRSARILIGLPVNIG